MGPMSAAVRVLDEIRSGDWPRPAGAEVKRLSASLHGSLAYTGVGHGTDRAVILGLAGHEPDRIDPDAIDPEDPDMLQDMVLAATNEAIRSAQELAASKMGGLAGGLGGLGLPGM